MGTTISILDVQERKGLLEATKIKEDDPAVKSFLFKSNYKKPEQSIFVIRPENISFKGLSLATENELSDACAGLMVDISKLSNGIAAGQFNEQMMLRMHVLRTIYSLVVDSMNSDEDPTRHDTELKMHDFQELERVYREVELDIFNSVQKQLTTERDPPPCNSLLVCCFGAPGRQGFSGAEISAAILTDINNTLASLRNPITVEQMASVQWDKLIKFFFEFFSSTPEFALRFDMHSAQNAGGFAILRNVLAHPGLSNVLTDRNRNLLTLVMFEESLARGSLSQLLLVIFRLLERDLDKRPDAPELRFPVGYVHFFAAQTRMYSGRNPGQEARDAEQKYTDKLFGPRNVSQLPIRPDEVRAKYFPSFRKFIGSKDNGGYLEPASVQPINPVQPPPENNFYPGGECGMMMLLHILRLMPDPDMYVTTKMKRPKSGGGKSSEVLYDLLFANLHMQQAAQTTVFAILQRASRAYFVAAACDDVEFRKNMSLTVACIKLLAILIGHKRMRVLAERHETKHAATGNETDMGAPEYIRKVSSYISNFLVANCAVRSGDMKMYVEAATREIQGAVCSLITENFDFFQASLHQQLWYISSMLVRVQSDFENKQKPNPLQLNLITDILPRVNTISNITSLVHLFAANDPSDLADQKQPFEEKRGNFQDQANQEASNLVQSATDVQRINQQANSLKLSKTYISQMLRLIGTSVFPKSAETGMSLETGLLKSVNDFLGLFAKVLLTHTHKQYESLSPREKNLSNWLLTESSVQHATTAPLRKFANLYMAMSHYTVNLLSLSVSVLEQAGNMMDTGIEPDGIFSRLQTSFINTLTFQHLNGTSEMQLGGPALLGEAMLGV